MEEVKDKLISQLIEETNRLESEVDIENRRILISNINNLTRSLKRLEVIS